MDIVNIFTSIVASVFLFIFAIQKFSNQVRLVAGDKLKDLITKATRTPIRGVLTGSVVTAIVQSSTAVTVILVGLVNAGLVTFYNSLGIILGANIGTTITSQLVAFKIIYLAPYILIAGFIISSTNTIYKRFGKLIFYFGLILLSLFFITVLTEPLQSYPAAIKFFSTISNVYVAIFVGVIASTILQSSSVVSGIVIILVAQGFFDFKEAFGIILGSNIGTTSTALIASIVMDVSAKKTAIAHFVFNLLGVLLFIPGIRPFAHLINTMNLSPQVEVSVANFIFNVITVVLALLFLNSFSSLINTIYSYFPRKEHK